MAGLGEVCSHVGAILFYLESANRTRLTCTQTSCVWKEPAYVEAIPYVPIAELTLSMSKPRISCNRKRGSHFASDTVPLAELAHNLKNHQLPANHQQAQLFQKLDHFLV